MPSSTAHTLEAQLTAVLDDGGRRAGSSPAVVLEHGAECVPLLNPRYSYVLDNPVSVVAVADVVLNGSASEPAHVVEHDTECQ
ncbi:hypothetical protein FGB62_21g12 [Gracilaria domingensis]|nr:hypothetical protein FGB62_21g12 [Gracilaria domingensis]